MSKPTSMIEQLAKDYTDYAKVDLSSQMKSIHESIEDLMIRLEELESIIKMVQMENAESLINHLQALRPEVIKLCKRIDALECIITRANIDLSVLESAVDTVEAQLGVTEKLFGILSFFKKAQEPTATNRVLPYEPPAIFRTDDYFEKQ